MTARRKRVNLERTKEDVFIEYILEGIYDIFSSKTSREKLRKDIVDFRDRGGYNKKYLHKRLIEKIIEEKRTIKIKPNVLECIISIISPKMYFVYKLYSKGELIYIGLSCNINIRIQNHLTYKEFDKVELFCCKDSMSMKILEGGLILKYLPRLNNNVNLKVAKLFDGMEPKFNTVDKLPPLVMTTLRLKRDDSYLYKYRGLL
jgi:hypothetical protein